MFTALLAQKNQSKIILLTAVVVIAVIAFAFMGKTDVVTAEDGSQTIQRSIFGVKIGK